MKCFGKPNLGPFFKMLLLCMFAISWTGLCVVLWLLSFSTFQWRCWADVFEAVERWVDV